LNAGKKLAAKCIVYAIWFVYFSSMSQIKMSITKRTKSVFFHRLQINKCMFKISLRHAVSFDAFKR